MSRPKVVSRFANVKPGPSGWTPYGCNGGNYSAGFFGHVNAKEQSMWQ